LKSREFVEINRLSQLWNFFSDKPKYTNRIYTDNIYTTVFVFVILDYETDIVYSILNKISNYINKKYIRRYSLYYYSL